MGPGTQGMVNSGRGEFDILRFLQGNGERTRQPSMQDRASGRPPAEVAPSEFDLVRFLSGNGGSRQPSMQERASGRSVPVDDAPLQPAPVARIYNQGSDLVDLNTDPAPSLSEKTFPVAVTAATSPIMAAADTPADGLEGFYAIQKGDTLGDLTGGDYELARKIAEYNNLGDWNKINTGQTLRMKGEWLTPSNRLLNNTLANIRYPG